MIRGLTITDSRRVASIHCKELEGDFLPSLGKNFLVSLYTSIIGKNGIYGYGYYENNKLYGFVIGAEGVNTLFKEALKSSFFSLAFHALSAVASNPTVLFKIFETFFYSSKEKGPSAELVVIAVDRKKQGKGIGKKLVSRLEGIFLNSGVVRYKVTVHMQKEAVHFYERLGYQKISFFKQYGKIWCVYTKKVNKRKYARTSKRKSRLS